MYRSVGSGLLRAYAFLSSRQAIRSPEAAGTISLARSHARGRSSGSSAPAIAALQRFVDHRHEPFQLFADATIIKSAETAGIDLIGASLIESPRRRPRPRSRPGHRTGARTSRRRSVLGAKSQRT